MMIPMAVCTLQSWNDDSNKNNLDTKPIENKKVRIIRWELESISSRKHVIKSIKVQPKEKECNRHGTGWVG